MANINDERLQHAYERVKKMVHYTPFKQSKTLNEHAGCDVHLKLENLQKTGSFKIRGTFNKISQLSEEECAHGLVAASAGNHAQGVALAGKQRLIPVTIFMPIDAPQAKIDATEKYGATVKLAGKDFDAAYKAAQAYEAETGATFIPTFNDMDIIEGHASVAIEMLEQQPDLEVIVVPAGGGGLIAGTALAIKAMNPAVKIIGVQAENVPSIVRPYYDQSVNYDDFKTTIAEGIAVQTPGEIPLSIIKQHVDAMITVSEKEIASTILFVLEREKVLIEGAAASALAAIIYKKLPIKASKIGVIVSGGNFDINKLETCIHLSKE